MVYTYKIYIYVSVYYICVHSDASSDAQRPLY